MDDTELNRAFRERARQLLKDPEAHNELCARLINTYWFQRGKKMNARIVNDGSRPIIISSSVGGNPLEDAK